jgi:hypothetical protein
MVLMVIAGSCADARRWALRNGLLRDAWICAHGRERLVRVNDALVVVCNGWRRREEAHRLMTAARIRSVLFLNFRLVHAEDVTEEDLREFRPATPGLPPRLSDD